jgi:hypothetical protein
MLNQNHNREKLEAIEFNCEIEDIFFHEFCRNSKSVVVPVTSMIGSMASQEIIKMITYQFKSISNTIVFDSIHNTTSLFKI